MEDATKQAIADALEGSSGNYDGGICEQHGIELGELECIAGEMGVIRCECCGWWVAADETIDGATCDDCIDP